MSCRSGATDIEEKLPRALNIGLEETQKLHVDGTNRGECYRRTAFERKLTFEPQSSVGSGNLGRIERDDGIRVTYANGARIADLQPLIFGLQGWNDYLRLHPSLVIQWTFRRSMHFQNAAWTISFHGRVESKQ